MKTRYFFRHTYFPILNVELETGLKGKLFSTSSCGGFEGDKKHSTFSFPTIEETNKPEKYQEIDKKEVKQIRLNEFLKTSTYDNFGFSRRGGNFRSILSASSVRH